MNPISHIKLNVKIMKGAMELKKLNNEAIEKALEQNKFACICLKAQKFQIAEKHLREALQALQTQLNCPVTNIIMNLANLNSEQKQFQTAVQYYKEVIQQSPFGEAQVAVGPAWSPRLNSYEAFVDAHTNLACLLANLDQHEEAYLYCLKAIQLQPNNFEAQTNFGDLLRQLGRQQEAIEHTWTVIKEYTKQERPEYQIPEKIKVAELEKSPDIEEVNVICMKWGTKYGADYVNKLFRGFKRNTKKPFNFICVTDNTEGLEEGIMTRELQKGWTGWWGKATLFMNYDYPPGRLFFIDLDMVITGNVDEILNYNGEFGILKTDDIACEKANKNGINSSIMVWKNREVFKRVFEELNANWKNISKFIVRFDFWLEMMIQQPDFLQDLYPTQISDFLQECQNQLPENTRIVCFPRMPKPEHQSAEWIKEHWV